MSHSFLVGWKKKKQVYIPTCAYQYVEVDVMHDQLVGIMDENDNIIIVKE